MTVVIVVILHQFLILQVSVLLLDGVQLISQSNVVFVALLDFEDLGLELADKQIFLVACKVDGIVVLKRVRVNDHLPWPF